MSPHPERIQDSVAPVAVERLHSRTLIWLFVLLSVAALLRLLCMTGEAWFDEVSTWDMSRRLTWPGGLFYQLHEENNHYLNTLFVWALRDQPWVYWRVPAVFCGLAAVWIAWRLGQSHGEVGRRAGWLAGTLTAASYLMVHYSSEARGYAYAVFFAALAFQQLQILACGRSRPVDGRRGLRRERLARWLFPAACCGGFLSQPIFLGCFAAMAVWICLPLVRRRAPKDWLLALSKCFLAPVLFFAALYVVDFRHALNVGGEQLQLGQVLIETLSLAGGGPFDGWGSYLVAAVVAGVFVHGLRVLARTHDSRWVFYLLAVVVMPVLLILVLRRTHVYPRYFLIAVFFLLQATSVGLMDLLRRGPVHRTLATIGLVAVVCGNGFHIARLAQLGRGGYLPVLRSVPAGEPSGVIELRSDSDVRQALMFTYYLPFADLAGKAFHYVNRSDVPAGGTAWLLTHTIDVRWQPPSTCAVRGTLYDLWTFRPYAGLSGWGLALYRRRPMDAGPPPAAVHPAPGC